MDETKNQPTKRREFIQICSAAVATNIATNAAPALAAPSSEPSTARKYARVKLVDADNKPLKLKSLKTNHNYVFNYPYAATPCFLLKLDASVDEKVGLKTEAGAKYDWPGGAGPEKTLVAYSAICAHKLAYPTPQVSFIGFRASASAASARGKVITCCADKSVYDPAAGAKVMSGPAPQPLATILLEHDTATDEIYAVGTFGGERFNEFFAKYDFKLKMEMGDKAKDETKTVAVVKDLANYSAQTAQC
jgi:arsenite oxidase small subunit